MTHTDPTDSPVPTIDVARLRKELEYVTAHRHQWAQGTWLTRTACGTVGCIAGNTVLNAGYRPVYSRGCQFTHLVEDGDGTRCVDDVAAELLDLTRAQSRELFQPTNSLYRLWELAERLSDGAIRVPPDVRPSRSSDRAFTGESVANVRISRPIDEE